MLNKIVSKIHWAIIFWMGYNINLAYNEHLEKMAELRSRIPAVHSQISRMKKELDQLETHFADMEKAKGKMEKVAQNIEKLQKQLPSRILDADVINKMTKIGEDLNIKNLNIKSNPELEKEFYFSKIFVVSATGTYLQFLLFLEKLSESERLLNVGSLHFLRSKKEFRGSLQLIDVNIGVISYRYNPNYDKSKETSNIESGQGNTEVIASVP